MKLAVMVVEVKSGVRVKDVAGMLAGMGFKKVSDGIAPGYTKEVASVDEAKALIQELNGMGLGTRFGGIEKGLFTTDIEDREAKKAIYFFKKENNLR